MVLMETNKIRSTTKPSEEYHHLGLRDTELPKIQNSFGKPQWDFMENDEEWFRFFVWPLTDVVSSSYFQDPKCPWVLSIGGIWTSYSRGSRRYAQSNIFGVSWKCNESHCEHTRLGYCSFETEILPTLSRPNFFRRENYQKLLKSYVGIYNH